MKKNLSLLIAALIAALSLYSQAPDIFNYQGIARNSVGNVLENKTITLRLSIYDISSAGPMVYQESRTVTTNPFGLFNIQVGGPGANAVTGSIATVNWPVGNKYLKVEIDPTGGTSFINLGVSQLASVPYALSSADNYWRKNGNDIYKTNSGNVGIGTETPLSNLHIKSNVGTSLMLQGIESRIQFNKANGDLSGMIYNNGFDMFINQYGGRITFGTGLFDRLTISPEGNIGIGTPAPHPSSKLEINSTNSGLLIPRITEAQRNAISSPATSLMIYQTDNTPGFYHYEGNAWTKFNTGNIASHWQANGNNIYNNNSRNVGIGTINPLTKLHIESDNETEALRLSGNFGTYMSFYQGANYKGFLGVSASGNDMLLGASTGNLGFSTNGLTRMRINSNGLVQVLLNNEALRLQGNDSYMSLFNGANWNGSLGVTGSDIELGTPSLNSNGAINFFIRGITRMSIQNDGRVRVGALGCNIPLGDPGGIPPKFSLQGSFGFKKSVGDQIGEWAISYGSNFDNYLNIFYNGGQKAYVKDTDGDWIGMSDNRLKENLEKYKSVLNGIKKLDVLTYHYKADKTGTISFGLIAQNVQQYFPEIVSQGEPDGLLGIAYAKTGVLAIKAIQEQQVIIETLEKKIEMLEKRMAALENKLK